MNLAIDEAIFIEKMKKTVPTTLRLWRNNRAVIIGCFQNVEAEVNLEICRMRQVQVIRRFSGGGAVYHDLGNLNHSLAIETIHPLLKDLNITQIYERLSLGVIECLKEFGIQLTYNYPSDLFIGSNKISGNALSRKKGTIFHHGTLMVNVDLDLLRIVLNAPHKKLTKKGIRSKKSPVMNLVDKIGDHVKMYQIQEALQRGVEKAYSVKLVSGKLISEEKKKAQQLYVEKYSKMEWNFRR